MTYDLLKPEQIEDVRLAAEQINQLCEESEYKAAKYKHFIQELAKTNFRRRKLKKKIKIHLRKYNNGKKVEFERKIIKLSLKQIYESRNQSV